MDFDGTPNDPCIDSPAVNTHVALIQPLLLTCKVEGSCSRSPVQDSARHEGSPSQQMLQYRDQYS